MKDRVAGVVQYYFGKPPSAPQRGGIGKDDAVVLVDDHNAVL
jgi:hypothetical protein